MKDTRANILAQALALANANGISGVSLRAIAKELGLSPGNVSYHFRRKEDLILGLMESHSSKNREYLATKPESLAGFLQLFGALFRQQHRFRGLVIALPDLLETYESMRVHYRGVEKQRRQGLFDLLEELRSHEEIAARDEELWRVVSHITLIARFWIAEARVSYKNHSIDRVIGHYQALLADCLTPYITDQAASTHREYSGRWLAV